MVKQNGLRPCLLVITQISSDANNYVSSSLAPFLLSPWCFFLNVRSSRATRRSRPGKGRKGCLFCYFGMPTCDLTRWSRYTTRNPHAASRTGRHASMLEWNDPIDGKKTQLWKVSFFSWPPPPFQYFDTTSKQLKPSGSADGNMIAAACAIHITVLGILYMQVPFSVMASTEGLFMAKFSSLINSGAVQDWGDKTYEEGGAAFCPKRTSPSEDHVASFLHYMHNFSW